MHARIAARIVLAANVDDTTTVFEIGAGTGMLTRELLKRAKRVIALEADRELYDKLLEDFVDDIALKKLELHYGDVRHFDPTALPKRYRLVANIPYYITGEIIRSFLGSINQPESMTLLVQKEVAERIARSKKESILSLAVKAYSTPRYEFTVPRGAFKPAPKIDSAVLTLANVTHERFAGADEEARFFALVHAGFAHKRKYLQSNLSAAGYGAIRVPERVRAEDLSLDQWLALARHAHC